MEDERRDREGKGGKREREREERERKGGEGEKGRRGRRGGGRGREWDTKAWELEGAWVCKGCVRGKVVLQAQPTSAREGSSELCIQAVSHRNAISWMM